MSQSPEATAGVDIIEYELALSSGSEDEDAPALNTMNAHKEKERIPVLFVKY
jgi:hypothetical protein